METPVASHEAGKMPLMAVEARASPRQDDKKIAAPVAAKEVGKMLQQQRKLGRLQRVSMRRGSLL